MVTRLPDASQQAAANAVVDLIDAASPTAGKVEIRTGAQPADGDDAATGTLLVTITLPDPAYGAAAASGTAALSSTATGTAVAAGTAGWFRVLDGADVPVFDGACRATGDADLGEELVLDNTSIANGQDVTINTLNYTHPASE